MCVCNQHQLCYAAHVERSDICNIRMSCARDWSVASIASIRLYYFNQIQPLMTENNNNNDKRPPKQIVIV